MKARILFFAVMLLTAALFASSCNKVDLLKGTEWTHSLDTGEKYVIKFTSEETCTISVRNQEGIVTDYDRGEYYGEYKIIAIDWRSWGKMTGTVSGKTMTVNWVSNDPENVYTFKKN